MSTKLFFIRHGETRWNSLGRVQGRTDVELNEIGLYQAHLKKINLNNIIFDKIFTSPLIRAKETALIISKLTDQQSIITDEEKLIERSFGELEGENFDINDFGNDDSSYIKKYKGYESNNKLEKRVRELMIELSEKHNNTNIGLFCHSHVIKAALRNLNDSRYDYNTKIDNCGIVLIEVNDNKEFKLVSIDD